MQKPEHFDVVVVGAGPAGGLLGYYLAQRNVNVLIIDKKALPRYKACGGGLTKRALSLLPLDIDDVVEDYSLTARLSFQYRVVFHKTFKDPIIAMVMRDKFDHFLIKRAMETGAHFKEKTEFVSCFGSAGDLTIVTTKGNFKSKMLVGADGIHSKVGTTLKLNIKRKHMTAIEGEVFLQNPKILRQLQHTVHFDFGAITKGYGWVFPKKNHLSIGMLSVSNNAANLKSHFFGYLNIKGFGTQSEIHSLRGHVIPYAPSKTNRYANNRGLLVGDAAGIVDPITGEGIYYAFREAKIASDIISHALFKGDSSITRYNQVLKKDLLTDIFRAQKLAHVLYKLPKLSHRIMTKHGDKIAENHIKIITGGKTYSELHKEVFGVPGLRTLLSLRN
jgi:geranylgeranyl reductase family protein